jgi:hypothetical protein
MDAAPLKNELVAFRLEPGTLNRAKRRAEANGESLSTVIRRALRRELGMQETYLSLNLQNGTSRRRPHEDMYGPDVPGEGVVSEGGALL